MLQTVCNQKGNNGKLPVQHRIVLATMVLNTNMYMYVSQYCQNMKFYVTSNTHTSALTQSLCCGETAVQPSSLTQNPVRPSYVCLVLPLSIIITSISLLFYRLKLRTLDVQSVLQLFVTDWALGRLFVRVAIASDLNYLDHSLQYAPYPQFN